MLGSQAPGTVSLWGGVRRSEAVFLKPPEVDVSEQGTEDAGICWNP